MIRGLKFVLISFIFLLICVVVGLFVLGVFVILVYVVIGLLLFRSFCDFVFEMMCLRFIFIIVVFIGLIVLNRLKIIVYLRSFV